MLACIQGGAPCRGFACAGGVRLCASLQRHLPAPNTHECSHIHSHIHTYSHTHSFTHTHTYSHMLPHTYTHTLSLMSTVLQHPGNNGGRMSPRLCSQCSRVHSLVIFLCSHQTGHGDMAMGSLSVPRKCHLPCSPLLMAGSGDLSPQLKQCHPGQSPSPDPHPWPLGRSELQIPWGTALPSSRGAATRQDGPVVSEKCKKSRHTAPAL